MAYPYAWRTAESGLSHQTVNTLMDRVDADAIRDPPNDAWPMEFNAREPQQPRLNALMQRFLAGLSSTSRDLLLAWTRRDTLTLRADVASIRDTWVDDSKAINTAIAASESFERAHDSAVVVRMHSGARVPVGAIVRVLFGECSRELPVGLVLFEGRLSGDGLSASPLDLGVGSVVVRRRASSTSWHPNSALAFVDINPRVNGIDDDVRSTWSFRHILDDATTRRFHAGARASHVPSFMYVHKIASPHVLACDMGAMLRGHARAGEREIVLRPFVRFHVLQDDVSILPDNGAARAVRLLYTHVYVEDECPMCQQQQQQQPAATFPA